MSTLRERISAAAQELYLREGLEGFSMRKIAEMIGVSAPAIYRHYQNKDALLNEIVTEGLKILEGYLRPALDADTPYERLLQLTDKYLEFNLEQPKFFDFAFLIPRRNMSQFAEEITKHNWGTFRLAMDQVAACIEDGLFRKGDPLETSVIIWAEVHGLVTLYRLGMFGQDAEAFQKTYRQSVNRLLEGLKA